MWAESLCQRTLGMVPLNRQAPLKGTYSPDGKIDDWLIQVKSTEGGSILFRLADWLEHAGQSLKEGKYPMFLLVFRGHPSAFVLTDQHQWQYLWKRIKEQAETIERLESEVGVHERP